MAIPTALSMLLFFTALPTLQTVINCILFSVALQPKSSRGRFFGGFQLTQNKTHTTLQDSSERVTSSSQRPLPADTQQTQDTHIHAVGGIAILAIEQQQTAKPPGSVDKDQGAVLFAEFFYIYVDFYILVSVQNKLN